MTITTDATGADSLSLGLDNWSMWQSDEVAHEVILERALDKKVSQVTHYTCNIPVVTTVPLK